MAVRDLDAALRRLVVVIFLTDRARRLVVLLVDADRRFTAVLRMERLFDLLVLDLEATRRVLDLAFSGVRRVLDLAFDVARRVLDLLAAPVLRVIVDLAAVRARTLDLLTFRLTVVRALEGELRTRRRVLCACVIFRAAERTVVARRLRLGRTLTEAARLGLAMGADAIADILDRDRDRAADAGRDLDAARRRGCRLRALATAARGRRPITVMIRVEAAFRRPGFERLLAR